MASTAIADTENQSNKNGNNTEMERQLKERAERNRQRALLLKKSKVVTHPYVRCVSFESCINVCLQRSHLLMIVSLILVLVFKLIFFL